MRQQQVASSEGAPVSVARKGTVKNGRREDLVGDEKLGDCLKLGSRRVLVKIPGNKLKVAQQGKYNNEHAHKVPEVCHVRIGEQVEKEEEVIEQIQQRPISDGVSLPQWGQRKRLRFNNRVDVKAATEDTVPDLKAVPRSGRGGVKVEKSPGVPIVRIKRPAAVAKLLPSPELATGDSKRYVLFCTDTRYLRPPVELPPADSLSTMVSGPSDVEGTGATCTVQVINNHVNGALESEVNISRIVEVLSERPLVNPEKAFVTPADSPTAPPVVTARTEDNVPEDRAGLSEKVDMDLFQWPKFLVSLSRKEKEDDFFAIKGSKLPVRPKKRSKHMEKAITFVSPGAWLCDITRERYEVKEKKTTKKRPRGLKAMGSADSDSD